MKNQSLILLIWGMALIGIDANCQGLMIPGNATAPTRVGTLDGPLADRNYLGQTLVGDSPDSLTPLGATLRHFDGRTVGLTVSVPDHPAFTFVHVQFAAWDERLWGASFDRVPTDQLGLTDIVLHELAHTSFGFPQTQAIFRQPAIVPIPEPSVLALIITGAAIGALRWRVIRRSTGRSSR